MSDRIPIPRDPVNDYTTDMARQRRDFVTGHTGTAHDLAESVGAGYGKGAMSNAFWAPVSLRQRADGSTASTFKVK